MGITATLRGLFDGEGGDDTTDEISLTIEITNVDQEDAERLDALKDQLDPTAVTLTGRTADGEPMAFNINTQEAEEWQRSPLYNTAPEPTPDADTDGDAGADADADAGQGGDD